MPAAILLAGGCSGTSSREGRGQRTGASISSARVSARVDANARTPPARRLGATDTTVSGVGCVVAGIRWA